MTQLGNAMPKPVAEGALPPSSPSPNPPPQARQRLGVPTVSFSSPQNARIDALERRIAVLESRVNLTSKPAPTWQAPTASVVSAMLSSAVAVYGFWRVHRFSVMRQERDEFYKRVQDCVDVINNAAQTASKLWRETGENAIASGGVEDLEDAITDISLRLAFLKDAESTFNVDSVFEEFKRTATLNVEDNQRAANLQTADEARRTGRHLTHEMQTAFHNTFPTAKQKSRGFRSRLLGRPQSSVAG